MTAKQRYSRQREAIYNTIKQTDKHPTAEWIYNNVRQEIPNISLGTVYRNLRTLVAQHKIREVILEDNVSRYDGNISDHYHCICERCGTIYDISFDTEKIFQSIEKEISNFQIQSYKLELYGVCAACQ